MRTRLLFLENGKPAQGIRVKPTHTAEITESDQDGQLSLELETGNKELVVYHAGSWIPHLIRVEEQASLILVDLKDVGADKTQRAPKEATNFLDIGRLDLGERYVFERVLGRGGMGLVIKARDRLLNRPVAIKLLSDELTESREAQQIFLAEARHLATLAHPNLVAVHDISKAEERVFMVIEYVKGETLEKLVHSLKRLSLPIALKLAIQLTRVVSYLHDHGVIHRDIKLANAMVRHDGTLKLVDFGLARHFDELYIRGTRVRGTPAYMSPEQINGEHLSPASDVYQLGLCLFEMLTGRLPFQDKDVMYAHLHNPAPLLTELVPGAPLEIEKIISRCLNKAPQDRYPDAHALLKELQQLHQELNSATHQELNVEHAKLDESRHSYPRLHTQELESLRPLHHTTGMSFEQQSQPAAAPQQAKEPMRVSQIRHTTNHSLHALTEPKRISPAFLILFALAIVAASVLAQRLFTTPPDATQLVATTPAPTPALAPTPTPTPPQQQAPVEPAEPPQEATAPPLAATPTETTPSAPTSDAAPPVAQKPALAKEADAPARPSRVSRAKPAKKSSTAAPAQAEKDTSTEAKAPTKANTSPQAKQENSTGLFKLGKEGAKIKPDEPVELRKGFLPMK